MVKIPATIGTISALNEVSASTQVALRRRPSLSIIEPIIGERIKPGMLVMAVSRPALEAIPVKSRANHGKVMKTIEPEIMLVIDAN